MQGHLIYCGPQIPATPLKLVVSSDTLKDSNAASSKNDELR
jgi:hypothetical protein